LAQAILAQTNRFGLSASAVVPRADGKKQMHAVQGLQTVQ